MILEFFYSNSQIYTTLRRKILEGSSETFRPRIPSSRPPPWSPPSGDRLLPRLFTSAREPTPLYSSGYHPESWRECTQPLCQFASTTRDARDKSRVSIAKPLISFDNGGRGCGNRTPTPTHSPHSAHSPSPTLFPPPPDDPPSSPVDSLSLVLQIVNFNQHPPTIIDIHPRNKGYPKYIWRMKRSIRFATPSLRKRRVFNLDPTRLDQILQEERRRRLFSEKWKTVG